MKNIDITKLTRITTGVGFSGLAATNGNVHDPVFWINAVIAVASFLKGFFSK